MEELPLVNAKQVVSAVIRDLTLHSDGSDCFAPWEINRQIPNLISIGYIKRIVGFLEKDGLVEVHQVQGPLDEECFVLTEDGFIYSERLPEISSINIYGLSQDTATVDQTRFVSGKEMMPDKARVIRIEKSNPIYIKIGDGLRNVRDQVRAVNDNHFDAQIRDDIVGDLNDAIGMWDSAEFTYGQFRIGIILTLERSQIFLKRTITSVGNTTLGNMVSDFIRNWIS